MTFEVRYCPQCGTRRTGYFRFCGRCGFDFDDLTIGKPPEPGEPSAPPKPEPTTPIWPPPVQWPPPEAAPPPPEPQPVTWQAPPAPSTPARIVQPSTEVPILAEALRPPKPRPVTPVVGPVPAGPVDARRPLLTWTRIAIVVLAALLGVNAISRAMTSSQGSAASALPTAVVGSPLIVASPPGSLSAPAVGVTPGPSFGPTGQTQFAVVTKVIDGDTIRVTIDGAEYPVRYIGIDAFEPDATDPNVKRIADDATATNSKLVEGQEVYLERDVSDTDQFDRLLRNVWLVDSGGSQVLVNLELVRLGFATVTTFPPDEKYVNLLTSAQAAAKSEGLGLWASAPIAATPSPAAVATPKTLVGAGGDSNCHPSYSPCLPIVADLDCPDVRNLGKAPITIRGPDEYRLDGDNDGLGCE